MDELLKAVMDELLKAGRTDELILLVPNEAVG